MMIAINLEGFTKRMNKLIEDCVIKDLGAVYCFLNHRSLWRGNGRKQLFFCACKLPECLWYATVDPECISTTSEHSENFELYMQ